MMQAKNRADNAATQRKQEPVINRQVKNPSVSKQVKAPSNISVEDRARLKTMAASINKETRERMLTNLRESQNKRESKNNGNVSIFGLELGLASQNLGDVISNELSHLLASSGKNESAADKELKKIFGS